MQQSEAARENRALIPQDANPQISHLEDEEPKTIVEKESLLEIFNIKSQLLELLADHLGFSVNQLENIMQSLKSIDDISDKMRVDKDFLHEVQKTYPQLTFLRMPKGEAQKLANILKESMNTSMAIQGTIEGPFAGLKISYPDLARNNRALTSGSDHEVPTIAPHHDSSQSDESSQEIIPAGMRQERQLAEIPSAEKSLERHITLTKNAITIEAPQFTLDFQDFTEDGQVNFSLLLQVAPHLAERFPSLLAGVIRVQFYYKDLVPETEKGFIRGRSNTTLLKNDQTLGSRSEKIPNFMGDRQPKTLDTQVLYEPEGDIAEVVVTLPFDKTGKQYSIVGDTFVERTSRNTTQRVVQKNPETFNQHDRNNVLQYRIDRQQLTIGANGTIFTYPRKLAHHSLQDQLMSFLHTQLPKNLSDSESSTDAE